MRAGDHQHGDGVLDRPAGVALEHPPGERERTGRGRDVEQPRRGTVGECLGARTRSLRLRHETLDPGQRGVVADRVDPDPHGGVGRDRARDDPVARPARDGPRLAGHHRLVDLRLAVDDPAVGRYPPTRTHEHDVARGERREGHGVHVARRGDALRLVGQ